MKKFTQKQLETIEKAIPHLEKYFNLMKSIPDEKLESKIQELDFICCASNYQIACQINFLREIIKQESEVNN